MAGKSKIDVIFADSERAQQALQHFVFASSTSEISPDQDFFSVMDYSPLFLKLSETITRGCKHLPFDLVVESVMKLWISTSTDIISMAEWMSVVELLCKELQETEDETRQTRIMSALQNMSSLAGSSYDTILEKFKKWPPSLRLQAIVLMNDLLIGRPDRAQSIPTSVFNYLVYYFGVDYEYEIMYALGSLLVKVVKECTCSFSSSLVRKVMDILKTGNIGSIKTYSVFPLISTMTEKSSPLITRFIMEENISSVLLQIVRKACWYEDSAVVEQFADICYCLARYSSCIISQDQYLEFAQDLLIVGMTIKSYQYYTWKDISWKVFNVFEELITHMSHDVFDRLVMGRHFASVFIGYLTYSNDERLMQNILKLIQTMAEIHKDSFAEKFVQEGGVHSLIRVQAALPLLSDQVDNLFRCIETENENQSDISKTRNWKIDSENSDDVEDTIIEILKEISSFEMTAFEFLQSGQVEALLDYFSNPTISMDQESTSSTEYSEEGLLHYRIMMLLERCKSKCQNPVHLVCSLVKVISEAMMFVHGSPFQEKSEDEHHCTNHPEFTGTVLCALHKSDPRHDLLLLLSLVDKMIRLIPVSDVYEAADRSLVVGNTEDEERVMAGFKELSLSHFHPLMVCFAVPWWKMLISTLPVHYVDEFVTAYPFASGLQFKRAFMQHIYNIGGNSFGSSIREVEISRDTIMESVMEIMEEHSEYSEIGEYELQVKFKGEEGQGPGPTREFYTLVCEGLQSVDSGMWRENKNGGLFPRPYQDGDEGLEQVVSRFKLLGYLMATVLVDGHLLDLELSHAFYKLFILQQSLSAYDILCFDPELGLQILQLKSLARKRSTLLPPLASKLTRDEMNGYDLKYKGVNLKDLYYGYELPKYPNYKLSKNKDELLDLDNLEQYIEDVMDATNITGVSRQVNAFREGFSNVRGSLSCFELHEIKSILCGHDGGEDWAWSQEELHQHLDFEFNEDYNEDERGELRSSVIEIILGFGNDERSQFLKLVTGSRRVPSGGLGAMDPKITVHVFSRGSCNQDALPSAATCVHLLKMPFYTSKDILRNKLLLAMAEGQGSFGFY